MSKIWWLVLIVGGLLYPTKALALPPILDCGWCGNSCGEVRPDTACIALAPPEGKACVFQDGACTIVEKEMPLKCDWCGDKCVEMNPRMACNKMAPPVNQSCVNVDNKCVVQKKEVAGEGEMCGGIRGIMCDTGLVCKYGKTEDTRNLGKPIVADEMGICVKDGSGGPICIPRPACMDGIEDPVTGKMIFCDPPTGMNICPVDVKGDANKDGKADLVDFTIWKKESMLRAQGPDASADFDGNGIVNSADFLVWRSSYLVIKK